ncbi:MAG: flagellar FliL protein [Rhodobacteraceae bacterium HLUCCO07]|nr:MAG: flagellar FliL protein [Rhodobacteraceae bacterium HLUCCO07]
MADTQDENDEAGEGGGKKRSKAFLFMGLTIGIIGAAGGFYAAYSGYIPMGSNPDIGRFEARESDADDMPDVRFVPIEPIVVQLRTDGENRHLRFRAQLEVPSEFQGDVTRFLPRVADVINGYLRALDYTDIADSAALVRIRGQILRRIKTVIGEGKVNDLLIMEFAVI